MAKEVPYLSVVVAARNDNYGGDFETRLQNCVSWFDYYANQYNLPMEFIIVNYNPVSHRPQLQDCIKYNPGGIVQYKIITVPASFHQQLETEPVRKPLPFYEYIAKNIGIRRATGQYILSANPDILPDPSILKIISKRTLNKEAYYRADRADFTWLPGKMCTPTDLTNIRRQTHTIQAKAIAIQLKKSRHFFLRIIEAKIYSLYFRKRMAFFRRFPNFARKRGIYVPPEIMSHTIHAHASGDFILMHKEHWHKIKGHPESTYLPVHTDAITVAMAASLGLEEKIFLCPCYHQEHTRRFQDYEQDAAINYMYKLFENDGQFMLKNNTLINYNSHLWGAINQNFETERIDK